MSQAASDYDEPWKEVCDTFFQRVLELSCPDLVTEIDWPHAVQSLNTGVVGSGPGQVFSPLSASPQVTWPPKFVVTPRNR